jgi:signal transduction histidine kinase
MTLLNSVKSLFPPRSRSRWLAAGLFMLALAGPLATGWLVLAGCDPFSINDASARLPLGLTSGPAFAILGSLIFVYRPHNRIGWLCLALGFCLPSNNAVDLYIQCGLTGTIAAPGIAYAAWFLYSYGTFAILPLVFLMPMVYPTGRFLSPRWRWLAIASLIVFAMIGTALGLIPDFSRSNGMDRYAVANPFGLLHLPAWWFSLFYTMFNLGFVFLNLVAIAAMVVRFRRSVGDERQQMKWLAYFLTMAIGVQMLFFNIPGTFFYPQILESVWFDLILWVIFLGFPLVIGIAIFKYRLYAIDVVINRTLVYGGLTLVVVLIYTLTVGGLGLLFQTAGNFIISLIATALIAVAFQPARDRLQRGVNRFMFGQRDDPYAVLSHLSQQLQTTAVPTETLTSIVETIAATLKLPYAAIELLEQEEQIGRASVGEPVSETVELPLRYQKETVGRLLVSPRASGEKFTAKEQQLLADIAAQTGPVASATRLTMALQRSREKLVLAREEERRRIRRDLHDGLGPTLASQTLKLDTVLDLLTADPRTAEQHVKQLKSQTQQMVADIRRLVYELRPPALDELGLLEALRAHVAQMNGANDRLRISIEAAPEPLPTLPAAIEVAAYRIALEGVTNVIRHAQAHNCRIRLVISEDEPPSGLVLTVADDGPGMPAKLQSGVGLTSMRERAEELGGRCEVVSNQRGGTRVTAVLPFAPGGET